MMRKHIKKLSFIAVLITMLGHDVCLGETSKKKSIAVLTLGANNTLTQEEVRTLTNRLRFELVKPGRFEVIGKAEMESVLQDSGLKPEGCYSADCAIVIGKALGVEEVITGTIEVFRGKYLLNILRISTSSAEAKPFTFEHKGQADGLLYFMGSIADQLAATRSMFGSLSVDVFPRTADIFVDEKAVSLDSLKRYKLEAGKHEVKLTYSRSLGKEFQIEANKEIRIKARFCPTEKDVKRIKETFLCGILLPGLHERRNGSKFEGWARFAAVYLARSWLLYSGVEQQRKLASYHSIERNYREAVRDYPEANSDAGQLGEKWDAIFSELEDANRQLDGATAIDAIVEISNSVLFCSDDIEINSANNSGKVLPRIFSSGSGIHFGVQLSF